MKFECPTCGKKYSLPDEKVPAGKDFKVKCKKCGEIIVLRAPESSDAPEAHHHDDEVPGQLAGGMLEQHMETAAPAPFAPTEPASGPDEQPTRVFDYSRMGAEDLPGASPAAAQSAQAAAFQPFAAAAPGESEEVEWHIAVEGEQMGPYDTAQMLEMMAAGQITDDTFAWRDGFSDWMPLRDISELRQVVEPPRAAAPAAPSPQSPFSVSRARSPATHDIFAAAGSESPADSSPFGGAAAGGVVSSTMDAPQSPRVDAAQLKGARHENSVLFSLSSLQALASSSRSPTPLVSGGLGSATSSGGSGLIDIRALTAGTGGHAASPSAPTDDILTMGGAGIGSTVGVPSLLQPERREPSKLPYILGGVFGLVAIAAIAVLLVLVLGKKDEPQIDEEALRQKIMSELMAKGMTAEQAEKAASQQIEEKAEPGAGAAEEGKEGSTPEALSPEEEAAAKKKKAGGKKKDGEEGSGDGGGPSKGSAEDTGPSGKKPVAAEDDLMALLAGATKGGKKPVGTEPKPAEEKKPATKEATPPASGLPEKPTKQDVMDALNGVKPQVQSCGKGQTGVATVSINIAGSTGAVASAKVVSGPFKDTPQASCIESAVKKAKFGKFSQPKFSVSYPFVIK